MRNPSKNTIKRANRGGCGLWRHHVGYMLWVMSKKKLDIRKPETMQQYNPLYE